LKIRSNAADIDLFSAIKKAIVNRGPNFLIIDYWLAVGFSYHYQVCTSLSSIRYNQYTEIQTSNALPRLFLNTANARLFCLLESYLTHSFTTDYR